MAQSKKFCCKTFIFWHNYQRNNANSKIGVSIKNSQSCVPLRSSLNKGFPCFCYQFSFVHNRALLPLFLLPEQMHRQKFFLQSIRIFLYHLNHLSAGTLSNHDQWRIVIIIIFENVVVYLVMIYGNDISCVLHLMV